MQLKLLVTSPLFDHYDLLILIRSIVISASNTAFEGVFESHKYDGKSSKNNWHYVTITYDSDNGNYVWTNKAGRKWKLYPSSVSDELKVGPDCPYYKSGHEAVNFTASGVYGPHGEFYSRECKCNFIDVR